MAATLPVAGTTAATAPEAISPWSRDTVLVGGVGVSVVHLAKVADATVIGTASRSTFEFLRQPGATWGNEAGPAT